MEEIKVGNEKEVINEEIPETSESESSKSDLDIFKDLLNNSLECKGYFDSLCDSTINKRLEKKLKKALEEDAAKKEKEKLKAEEENKIKQMEKEIALLKAEISYSKMLEESGLSSDLLKFLSVGVDNNEQMEQNIKIFKELLAKEVTKRVKEKITENPPIPGGSEGGNYFKKLWSK